MAPRGESSALFIDTILGCHITNHPHRDELAKLIKDDQLCLVGFGLFTLGFLGRKPPKANHFFNLNEHPYGMAVKMNMNETLNTETIKLNGILNIADLKNIKIRFVKSHKQAGNPLNLFNTDKEGLSKWLLWNYTKNKSFKEGQIVIGLVRIDGDKWLLFDVIRITKDLNIQNGIGYEYEPVVDYRKYLGRIVIHYKNRYQNLVRKATSVIDQCLVSQILDGEYNKDIFPGYDQVHISWKDMKRVITNDAWKTALGNQKGIYLITDRKTGQLYVGSAYGKNMLGGRWRDYIKNGHGGNKNLKRRSFEYIKEHFSYSILEIYKSTTSDETILNREYWWQDTLCTKRHGYNLPDSTKA